MRKRVPSVEKSFVKKDNSDSLAKIALRKEVLAVVKNAGGEGTVLNALPGSDDVMGQEWRRLGATVYTIASINELAAAPRVDIYDIDVYSKPFQLFEVVIRARPDRDYVLVGTDAGYINAQLAACSPRASIYGFEGPEKLTANYERFLLRKGLAMIGEPIRMLAIWKRHKSVLYFAWLCGRYAATSAIIKR